MEARNQRARDYSSFSEEQLVGLARDGDRPAFGALMQRLNRRLYRVARAIMRDDSEAEDVLQEAYVRAYAALRQFRGEAAVATWLTRIVMNEAIGRRRNERQLVELTSLDAAVQKGDTRVIMFPGVFQPTDPEAAAARAEIRRVLESAIDELPSPFRVTFLMRDVEELSVEETALALDIRPETVKTRLHRARQMLRKNLDAKLASTLKDTFPFEGARCERITSAVLERLGREQSAGSP